MTLNEKIAIARSCQKSAKRKKKPSGEDCLKRDLFTGRCIHTHKRA